MVSATDPKGRIHGFLDWNTLLYSKQNLNGFDVGGYDTESLGFWALSNVRNSKQL
jgi:hypothetical protein